MFCEINYLSELFELVQICGTEEFLSERRFCRVMNKCRDRHVPLLVELATLVRIATPVCLNAALRCAGRSHLLLTMTVTCASLLVLVKLNHESMVSGFPLANRREARKLGLLRYAKVPLLNASEVRRWSERACLRGMPDTILIHILILSLTDMELKL